MNKDTKMYFSVSSNPGNFGATLYNEMFNVCNINAFYKPLKLNNIDKFKDFLDSLQKIGASGLSVSMPFKKIAKQLSWTNYTDAFKIGNCNTLKFEENTVYGDNTDWYGFSKACENIFKNINGAIIYGTGAVSDSIVFALEKQRIPFFRIKRGEINRLINKKKFNFLINTTPVGMEHIKDNVFNDNIIKDYDYIFDVVVSKQPTNLIRLGNKYNKKCISGATMSMYQLAKQFEIYTETKPPIDFIFKKVMELYYVQI